MKKLILLGSLFSAFGFAQGDEELMQDRLDLRDRKYNLDGRHDGIKNLPNEDGVPRVKTVDEAKAAAVILSDEYVEFVKGCSPSGLVKASDLLKSKFNNLAGQVVDQNPKTLYVERLRLKAKYKKPLLEGLLEKLNAKVDSTPNDEKSKPDLDHWQTSVELMQKPNNVIDRVFEE